MSARNYIRNLASATAVAALGGIVLFLAFGWLAWQNHQNRDQQWQTQLATRAEIQGLAVGGARENLRRQAQSLVELVAADKRVNALIREGHRAVNLEGGGKGGSHSAAVRARLNILFAPYWQVLKAHGTRQLHAHLAPDAITLLRAHRPELFGDRLAEIRPLVMAVLESGEPRTGLEVGRHGAGLRAVLPVRADDRPDSAVIGALEVGFGLLPDLTFLDSQLNAGFALLLRQEADKLLLDQARARLIKDAGGNWLLDSFSRPEVGEWIKQGLLPSPAELEKQRLLRSAGHDYLLQALWLPDFQSERDPSRPPLAAVLVWQDVTAALAAKRAADRDVWRNWIVALLTAEALLFLLWHTTRQATRRDAQVHMAELRELNAALEQRVAERTRESRESEQRLRLFVQYAPAAIAMFDRDMRYVAFSRRWLADYKLGDHVLTGRSHYEVFPDLPERWKEIHRRCLAGAVEKADEDPIPRGDGSVDWVRWEVHPWYAGEGRIGGLIIFSEIITERKRAEQQRQAENSVLESISTGEPLAATLDGIARNVEALSPGTLCSILLLDEDGLRVRSGAAPSLPEEFNRAIDGQPIGPKAGSCGTAAFRNEQVIVTDIATDPLWADYAALALPLGLRACWSTPVRSGAGKVLGTFALYYRQPRSPGQADLDLIERWTRLTGIAMERTRADDEIRKLNEDLERRVKERTEQLVYADRAKDSFLAAMSHEVRTPLGGLLGMLELLALSPLGGEQRETLHAARASGRSLSRIVDDILDWSKIEAGMLELAPTASRTAEIVAGVANTYARIASAKGLLLRQHVDPALSPALIVDPLRVSQVLNNFASNAIKFTRDGEVEIRAELLGRDEGVERVCFSVRDTGLGIDKAAQARLFQTYAQGNAETARMYGGTGLGLAICRRLADLMNAQIDVESAPGRGSIFRLTLSVAIAAQAPEPAEVLTAAGEAKAVAPLVPAGAAAEAPVVLIADDYPTNRELLARQLKLLGLRAETADSGVTALRMWREGGFDIVITDCHMPELDGYALTQAIREIEATEARRRSPIIAWTANVLPEEAERCREAGMDDLLTKPTPMPRLRAALEKWLPAIEKRLAGNPRAETSQARPDAEPPIDFAQLAEVAADRADQLEILRGFQSHNPGELRDLRQALAAPDLAAAARTAHRLSGASQLVGARQIAAVCAAIEAAARRGDGQAALASGALLEQAVHRFDDALAAQARERGNS